jgi:hypothetical protein
MHLRHPGMVGTRSLSSGARSRDPLALPTLRVCDSYHIQISNSVETCIRIPAARSVRVLHPFRPHSMSRGRREDRVRAAPAVSCAKCTTKSAHEHTGSAENTRPSLRDGLQLITCSSRRTAFLPPSSPGSFASRKLDTSTAVPEPHAFAVRLARARQSRARRPPHLIATFVTIATRPSFG